MSGLPAGVTAPLSGDWTIEAYVLLTQIASSPFFGIGNTGETAAENFQALLWQNASNQITAFWENGAGTNIETAMSTIAVAKQSGLQVVCVKDGTANTVTFFLNGIQIGPAVSYTNEPTGGTSVFTGVGAFTGQTNSGVGLACVAFYNGIKLSADRIAAHARAAGY